MTKEQETIFWKTIYALNDLGILSNIMIIGSWAEYLYPPLFETDFIPNIKTRDVDFFYRNIRLPKVKVPLIATLKEIGYVYDEVDGISRFYNADLLELEFLTRILGSGTDGAVEIKPLGIKSEGLRVINILYDFPLEIEKTDENGNPFTLTVPEPSVYAVQKILTNPIRQPPEKKAKDIAAVKELLYHIQKSAYHSQKLLEVCKKLSAKQVKTLKTVCGETEITGIPL